MDVRDEYSRLRISIELMTDVMMRFTVILYVLYLTHPKKEFQKRHVYVYIYTNYYISVKHVLFTCYKNIISKKNDQLSDHPLSVMAKHRCLDAAMSSTRTSPPPKTSKGTLWGRGTSGSLASPASASLGSARQPLPGRPQEYNLGRWGWNLSGNRSGV